MRGFSLILLLSLWCGTLGVLAGVAPLTPAQQIQVQTAEDDVGNWDEAALYPLLLNALMWKEVGEPGAMIPDWPAILASPGSYRGQLFMVEGQLGGPPVEVTDLARVGAWTGRVQRWGVLYQVAPDAVAVVYVLDGTDREKSPEAGALPGALPGELPGALPGAGAGVGDRVRILGRFFKIWRHPDQDGQVTAYPVFVGRVIAVAEPRASSDSFNQLYMLLIVAAAAVWYMLRRVGRTLRPKKRQALAENVETEKNSSEGVPRSKLADEKLPDALRQLALENEEEQ